MMETLSATNNSWRVQHHSTESIVSSSSPNLPGGHSLSGSASYERARQDNPKAVFTQLWVPPGTSSNNPPVTTNYRQRETHQNCAAAGQDLHGNNQSSTVILVNIDGDESEGQQEVTARILPRYRKPRRHQRKGCDAVDAISADVTQTQVQLFPVPNIARVVGAALDSEKSTDTHDFSGGNTEPTTTTTDDEAVDSTVEERRDNDSGRSSSGWAKLEACRPLLFTMANKHSRANRRPVSTSPSTLQRDDIGSSSVHCATAASTDSYRRSPAAIAATPTTLTTTSAASDSDDVNATVKQRRNWRQLFEAIQTSSPASDKRQHFASTVWRAVRWRQGRHVDDAVGNRFSASLELTCTSSSLAENQPNSATGNNKQLTGNIEALELLTSSGRGDRVGLVDLDGGNRKEKFSTAVGSAGGGVEDVVQGCCRRQRCVDCCKSFVAFFFSTVGSCCLLVGYVIIGGLVFRGLEAAKEQETKVNMQYVRMEHIQRLWNLTLEMNVLRPENWSEMAESVLTSYKDQVFYATKKNGWDGKDEDSEPQWSYAGAMLYSITVITTIGYGHIAPRTEWGQVVTIIYAIFGIPLTLFTITNLGSIMATAFRFLYKYICCGLCCVCCTTSSSGSAARQHRKLRRHLKRTKHENGTSSSRSRSGGRRAKSPKHMQDASSTNADVKLTLRQRLSAVFSGTTDISKVSVPIYVSLLLMTGYVLLGATLFWLAEGWDFLIAAYFCFITLSTIGFGDYVPGTGLDFSSSAGSGVSTSGVKDVDDIDDANALRDRGLVVSAVVDTWKSHKLVVCALYLVCGLALIAMCFDLMQEEAKNKFRRLGRRLGLLTDTNVAATATAT